MDRKKRIVVTGADAEELFLLKQCLEEKGFKVVGKPSGETLVYEGLRVDVPSKGCYVDGKSVALRKKELELLMLLMKHRGRILSRELILAKVWGAGVVVLDRTIDVNITRLRKAIAPYGRCIVTRSGYGYGFME